VPRRIFVNPSRKARASDGTTCADTTPMSGYSGQPEDDFASGKRTAGDERHLAAPSEITATNGPSGRKRLPSADSISPRRSERLPSVFSSLQRRPERLPGASSPSSVDSSSWERGSEGLPSVCDGSSRRPGRLPGASSHSSVDSSSWERGPEGLPSVCAGSLRRPGRLPSVSLDSPIRSETLQRVSSVSHRRSEVFPSAAATSKSDADASKRYWT
jgi:hypothetical protein